MSTRLLAVISEGQEAAAVSSMAALAAMARAEAATVRLAYFRRLPGPRVDAYDRIVASAELEMDRIEAHAIDALGAAARKFDGVAMEPVVRFGRPRREVPIEAEVFAAELVVLVTSASPGPLSRLRLWRLRRALAACTALRVLVLHGPPRPPRRVGLDATRPRWRGDMAGERP
jgi:universal stress protein family protein